MSMPPLGRIDVVLPGLEPQRTGIAGHLQVAAPDLMALAVQQLAQAFPVDRAGGISAVEFLVVDEEVSAEGGTSLQTLGL